MWVAVAEHNEQHLKTVDSGHLGFDSGSTYVGTGTSQGKHTGTSQGKPSAEEVSAARPMLGSHLQCPGIPQALDLNDLTRFRASLEIPLSNALRAFHSTDTDLCQALSRILQQVADLTESTASIVRTHRVLTYRILHDTLPCLRTAMKHGDSKAEAEFWACIPVVINKMKTDAQLLRSQYIVILEAILYLSSCVQLSLDFYECHDAPHELDDISSAPDTLRSALQDLKIAQAILADPSDFWLIFHVTELESGHVACTMQHIASMKPRLRISLCDDLEQLCLQYIVPPSQYVGILSTPSPRHISNS
jgi:hypothetical protein